MRGAGRVAGGLSAALAALLAVPACAQTCSTARDLDPATRQVLEQTAQQYFGFLAQGNSDALRQAAIAGVAADFSGIAAAVKDNAGAFPGTPTPRAFYLLDAQGQETLARAEFLCGIFGPDGLTSDSAVFVLTDLPAGRYAVVIEDAATKKGADAVSFILQQAPPPAGPWKLAGLYVSPTRVGDHDGHWYLEQARAYRAQGEMYNAFFYYEVARNLLVPVDFMTTLERQTIAQEQQKLATPDLPLAAPVALMAEGGRTFQVTRVYALATDQGMELVADYRAADRSDSQQTYFDNLAVIHALAAKLPEVKEAFWGIGVRALDSAGHASGTLLEVKDLK